MKAPRKAAAKAKKPATGAPRLADAVTLAAECTMAQADALHAQLGRALSQSAVVTIEIGAVRKIDAASLQLLAAFVHDRRASGKPVVLRGNAAAFTQSVNRLGLSSLLHTPSAGEPRA